MSELNFNSYILQAVNYLYTNYRLLGYDSGVLTHDITYGRYGTIQHTGDGRTMSMSAIMEVILTAMQLYATATNDSKVWDFLPKQSWEQLGANDIKAHIWVKPEFGSFGTADALRNFKMGENIPFRGLLPGSFINFRRRNGTAHAVVFLSYIDETGREYETWNETVIGFRYFSSQGGYDVGQGGLDYRYAIFSTDEYEQNGYPDMPYKRDLQVIYSTDQKNFNTGIMWHPTYWGGFNWLRIFLNWTRDFWNRYLRGHRNP